MHYLSISLFAIYKALPLEDRIEVNIVVPWHNTIHPTATYFKTNLYNSQVPYIPLETGVKVSSRRVMYYGHRRPTVIISVLRALHANRGSGPVPSFLGLCRREPPSILELFLTPSLKS